MKKARIARVKARLKIRRATRRPSSLRLTPPPAARIDAVALLLEDRAKR
jgi:hypothetical protein